MKHVVTKTFPTLSCAFRQWRAKSHCRYIHGYDIEIKLEFGADVLDENNWVLDFGGMKDLKLMLELMFDHRFLVAKDDPQLPLFHQLQQAGACALTELDAVGCEAFAEIVFKATEQWLHQNFYHIRVVLLSAKVSEHERNSALFLSPHLSINLDKDAATASGEKHHRVRRGRAVA